MVGTGQPASAGLLRPLNVMVTFFNHWCERTSRRGTEIYVTLGFHLNIDTVIIKTTEWKTSQSQSFCGNVRKIPVLADCCSMAKLHRLYDRTRKLEILLTAVCRIISVDLPTEPLRCNTQTNNQRRRLRKPQGLTIAH